MCTTARRVLTGVVVLLAIIMVDVQVADALHIPKALQDQLHKVEVFHMSKIHKRSLSSGKDTVTLIDIHFFNKTFELELRPNNEIFHHLKEAVIVDADGSENSFEVDKENYFIGSVRGDPQSAVALYVSPDGHLHGRITAHGDTYVLESAYRHYKDSTIPAAQYTVVYREQDLVSQYDPESASNASGHSFCGVDIADEATSKNDYEVEELSREDQDQLMHAAHHHRRSVSSINTICSLTLIADSQFYANNGRTAAAVTAILISHMTTINPSFKNQGWYLSSKPKTNVYTNIQLGVQKLVYYTSSASDPYYSATGYPGSNGPATLLTKMKLAPGQPDGWKTCLAHLFTHYVFSGGVLGLAWVATPAPNRPGGICHNVKDNYLNTGWTTDVNGNGNLPTLMNQIVTAHEIGHNFGSPHDTDASCLGSNKNRFIMFPSVSSGYNPNNRLFSPCSVDKITSTLAAKAGCFLPASNTSTAGGTGSTGQNVFPTCGNYLVTNSSGEQCDAGVDGDACCQGSAAAKPCNWIAQATCTDTTDVCCQGCQPANKSKICFSSFDNDLQCRATAACKLSSATTCTVNIKRYGIPCGDGGGICSGASATADACISLCSRFGADTCTCSTPDDCHLCCVHNANITNTCGSPFQAYGSICTRASIALSNVTNTTCLLQPYWTSRLGTPIYYNATQKDPACDGSPDCGLLLDYVPNSVCSIGLCDATGTCVRQLANNAWSWSVLGYLTFDNVVKWMRENIVGTVLMFSFVLAVPLAIGYYKCKKHKKQKEQLKTAEKLDFDDTLPPSEARNPYRETSVGLDDAGGLGGESVVDEDDSSSLPQTRASSQGDGVSRQSRISVVLSKAIPTKAQVRSVGRSVGKWFGVRTSDKFHKRESTVAANDPTAKNDTAQFEDSPHFNEYKAEHTPFFTIFVVFVQCIVLITSLGVYGISDISISPTNTTQDVTAPDGRPISPVLTMQGNFWIGPSPANLVLLAAKFSPCMRKDTKIQNEILAPQLATEQASGCCMDYSSDGGNCYTTTKEDCNADASFKQFVPGLPCGGPQCCQDFNAASQTSRTWPQCAMLSSTSFSNSTYQRSCQCNILARPCCLNLLGRCELQTKEYCNAMRGAWHPQQTLCSQVNCQQGICGLIPFYQGDTPDQWYRVYLPLFLHAGLFHLLIVLCFELIFMFPLEMYIGWARMACIFFISGIGGYLVSATVTPYQVATGALPACVGVLGCLLVNFRQSAIYKDKPLEIKLFGRELDWIVTMLFLVAAFIFGLLPYVDDWSNAGGLVNGALCALVFLPHIHFKKTMFPSIKKDHLAWKLSTLIVGCIGLGILLILFNALLYTNQTCSGCPSCVSFGTAGFCTENAQNEL